MPSNPLCIAAACLIALAGCSKKEETETEPIVPVEAAAVRQDSVQRIVVADAVLYPRDQANVMPKISAPVKKFYVNRGDHVKQGQLLATLENRDLAAAAVESRGQVQQAEANYRSTASASVPEAVIKAQQDVDSSKQALDAARKLLESRQQLLKEGALARKLVDEAQVGYAQARAAYATALEHQRALESVGKQEQIAAAKAQLESARGHHEGAEAQLGYSEIRSPITGVITDRPLYAGEMAASGSPLLTVMDISRVVARASVPIAEAAHLKVGDPATISQSEGSEEVAGKVTVVSPAADPNTTTVQVWVEANNPGERLKPGATVRVSVVAATLDNAIVVPPAAILPGSEGGESVMVVGADSVAHEHKVQVGVRTPDKVQILSGASVGDQVVVSGGVGLQDGAKVRVLKPGEKPGKEDKKGEEPEKK